MSKPLIANRERASEASVFHASVFAMFGGPKKLCSLCGKPGSTDAAHVIARAHLGPLRYADPRLARPAHRSCHEAQERREIEFSLEIRRDAITAHNAISKIKMVMP
jgi:hypothetical protein